MSTIQDFLEEAGVKEIKASGDNLIGLCPFHQDKHRSFSMNSQTGQFICFSESCGESGGLLAFLVSACDYSFKRARREAERFGLVLERSKYDDVSLDLPGWKDRRNYEAAGMGSVYEEKLLALYDFCPRYLRGRGFDPAYLKQWDIGFDFEVNRITMPVRDAKGRLIGMTKRSITDEYPKYLHLNFKKSRVLYGEHRKSKWDPKERLWVGEGGLDAIALQHIGLCNVVSTLGARVSDDQIKKLNSAWFSVVLAYDNDTDGIRATHRVGDKLVGWGKREVYVADFYPEGVKDPAELMQRGTLQQMIDFKCNIDSFDLWRLAH